MCIRDSSIEAANGTYNITNDSDEIGVLYPDLLEVTCKQDGDLSITNNLEGRVTFITGCTAGEKITMDCVDKIVTSSLASHKKIYNDFNFTFFRLYNSYSDRVNTITSVSYTHLDVYKRQIQSFEENI